MLSTWLPLHRSTEQPRREGPGAAADGVGRVGQVHGGGAELLSGVGVARWKAWPAIEKCLLKLAIIVDLSVVTVFPSWEDVPLFSMDFSVPELFGVCATGCKFLFEKASLCFPSCLCILVPNFPEKLHIAGAIRC